MNAGNRGASSFGGDILLPHGFAGCGVEAEEFSIGAIDEDIVAIDGGGGAWAVAALAVRDGAVDGGFPEFFAGLGVKADGDFAVVTFDKGKGLVTGDSDLAEGITERGFPEFPDVGNFFDGGFFDGGISGGATIVGPVGQGEGGREGEEGDNEERLAKHGSLRKRESV